jgi:hypothetical protein
MAEEILITRDQQGHIRLILDHSLESDDDFGRLGALCEDESETDKDMCLSP